MAKPKLTVLKPTDIPVLKFTTSYGTLTVYSPSNKPLSSEKVLLLLEQAKFKLLYDSL